MEISVSQAIRCILLMKVWCKEAVCCVAVAGWGSDVDHISAAGREHASSCAGQHRSWTGHRRQQCGAWDIPHAGGGTGGGPPMEDGEWTEGPADPQAREYSSHRSSVAAVCPGVSVTVVPPCLKVDIRTGFQFFHIPLASLGARITRYSDSLRARRSGDRIPVEGEIFHTRPDRPWGPPSLLYNVYWVFPGVKGSRGVMPTTHPYLVPRSWKSRAIPLLPLWALVACYRVKPYLALPH